MDDPQKRSIRGTARIGLAIREPLQVRWNRRFRKRLYGFITKLMDFSQSLSRVLEGGDIIWQKPNITQLAIH